MIYKILTSTEWENAQKSGQFEGSEVDQRDGFIHFSTPTQVKETAAKHFCGQNNLVMVGFDENSFGSDLKWEPSRNNELFPHFYGTLDLNAVKSDFRLELDDSGSHIFPDDMPK